MHVGLVTGVEDDPVPRGVEDPVQRDRQLDHAQVRPEVPAGARHRRHEVLADLLRQGLQLSLVEATQVGGPGDARQDARGGTARWELVLGAVRGNHFRPVRGGRV